MKLFALLGAGAMAVGTLAGATPAAAQYYHGPRGYHGYHGYHGYRHYPRYGYRYHRRGWHPYRHHYRYGYRHGYHHRW